MPSQEMMDLLLTRRSVVAKDLGGPGPSAEEKQQILQAAHRVPDHGKLGPWRFVIFEGDARASFGEVIAEAFRKQEPEADEARVQLERDRLTRAPLVICVISRIADHPKIPVWEQELSVGAACQNMLIAGSALGYGCQWLTEWYAFDDEVGAALGLSEAERVAGYMYFGEMGEKPTDRRRPSLEERISYWSPTA